MGVLVVITDKLNELKMFSELRKATTKNKTNICEAQQYAQKF